MKELWNAAPFIPRTGSLREMAEASKRCRGCPLYKSATQTVFGEGPRHSELALVGEQPGDQEDRVGRPFVGPAGRILNEALEAAGIERSRVYVTNAVKHFKFEVFAGGKRRIHKKPNAGEIRACHPWLQAELEILRPAVIVALGSTAAQSLLGRPVSVMRERGAFLEHALGSAVMITVHPSSLLRLGDDPEMRKREMHRYIDDFRKVAKRLGAAADSEHSVVHR